MNDNSHYGKVIMRWKEYVIYCSECIEYDVAHTTTRKQAIAIFRDNGWKTEGGEWMCDKCQVKK